MGDEDSNRINGTIVARAVYIIYRFYIRAEF